MSKGRNITYDTHIRSIGQITINFALLEELIADCIHILIGGELAPVITAQLSFRKLLDLLSSLYIQKYHLKSWDDLPPNLKELLSQAQQAEDARNAIVHSIWSVGDTAKTLTRIKKTVRRRKGLKIDIEHMRVQDLDEIANFVAETVYKAQEFALYLYEEYIPRLIAPVDGSLVTTRLSFSWAAVAGAAGYEFILAKDPLFMDVVLSKAGANALTTTFYLCEQQLDYSTTYYWKVRTISATFQSLWSDIWSFTPIGEAPPLTNIFL